MKIRAIACVLGLLAGMPAAAVDKLNLDWMAGHWCAESAKESSEEHWLPARGGLMLGVGRTVTKSRVSFEYMRIEIVSDSARFIPQPNGVPPTIFEMIDAGPTHVTFANPQHGFPKRVRYARNGDELVARVDDGSDGGKGLDFKWKRCSSN